MHSKDRGDLAEAKVYTHLIEMGYVVSEPHTENCVYDFIIDDGNELQKVQVKSAKMRDDEYIQADLTRTNPKTNGVKRQHYTQNDIDVFLIYCPQNEKVYQVPFDEAPKTKLTLRLKAKQDQPSIRWAEEYEVTT